MSELVSITLLNWNGKQFIEECIESVLAQTYSHIQFTIIDNCSTDGSPELIEEKYPGIQLVKNKQNVGYSRAHNQGIKMAQGSLIIPLNYDVVLDKEFVAELVGAIDADDKIGSVSGKLLRLTEDGKTDTIDSTGHLIFSNRYVVNRGEDKQDTGQYDTPDEIFGVCGAASLYRRDMLEDIKVNEEYLDEDFFIMLEDVDLDWRARLRGWKSVYNPEAVAYHYRTGSGAQKSRLLQRHYYKNRYLTFIKNDSLPSVLRHYPSIWLMDVYLHIDLVFTSPIALVQGVWDIIRLSGKMLKKRRIIQSQRLITPDDIEKWFHKYRFLNDVKRKLHLQNN